MSGGSLTYGRTAATLTEVLMAILIMGVGVVSVFTLFPISVLRTIQATNQTNAKILKENVEEQVAQSPVLLSAFEIANPAHPMHPSQPATGMIFSQEWKAGTAYPVNAVITPTIKPGSATHRTLALLVNRGGAPGTSGLVEPVWNPAGNTTDDGTVQWSRPSAISGIRLDRYVVDPLGWNTAGDNGFVTTQDFFGNKTDRTTGAPSAPSGVLRIHGGQGTALAAADVCTHPDSWQQAVQATPVAVTDTTATFPPTTDLNGLGGSILAAPRIVLTSSDGKQTVVRALDGPPVGLTVDWDDDLPTRFERPPGSRNFDVGQARIEIFNRRYSWFMTVRNVGARPEIKCVVTFNRSFASAEEHAYATNFGSAVLDVNDDGAGDALATNQVMVAWQYDPPAGWDPEGTGTPNGNEPDPLLKAGNWLFDARDASWYRIQSVDNSNLTATPRWATLTLDRSVRNVTAGAGAPDNTNPAGRAILIPGIVEIFDL